MVKRKAASKAGKAAPPREKRAPFRYEVSAARLGDIHNIMASCTIYTPGEPLIVLVSEDMIDAGLGELTRGRALGVPERETLGYVYRAMHQKAPRAGSPDPYDDDEEDDYRDRRDEDGRY